MREFRKEILTTVVQTNAKTIRSFSATERAEIAPTMKLSHKMERDARPRPRLVVHTLDMTTSLVAPMSRSADQTHAGLTRS